jgi:hypothetical protein
MPAIAEIKTKFFILNYIPIYNRITCIMFMNDFR